MNANKICSVQLTASANKQQMRRVSCVVWVNIQVAVSYSAVVMTRSNASKTRELTKLVINSGNFRVVSFLRNIFRVKSVAFWLVLW